MFAVLFRLFELLRLSELGIAVTGEETVELP